MTTPVLTATCPTWCDGSTHQAANGHDADPTLHAQAAIYVPITLTGDDNYFAVGLVRDDIEPGIPAHIGITVNAGWLVEGCPYADEAQLTPVQAREFARVLNHLADLGEQR